MPCSNLKQAVDNCGNGGVVFIQSDTRVTSVIKITKNISIVAPNGITLKGTALKK